MPGRQAKVISAPTLRRMLLYVKRMSAQPERGRVITPWVWSADRPLIASRDGGPLTLRDGGIHIDDRQLQPGVRA